MTCSPVSVFPNRSVPTARQTYSPPFSRVIVCRATPSASVSSVCSWIGRSPILPCTFVRSRILRDSSFRRRFAFGIVCSQGDLERFAGDIDRSHGFQGDGEALRCKQEVDRLLDSSFGQETTSGKTWLSRNSRVGSCKGNLALFVGCNRVRSIARQLIADLPVRQCRAMGRTRRGSCLRSSLRGNRPAAACRR